MTVTPTIPGKRRRGLKAIIIVIIITLIAAAYYLNSLLPIITGYAAKNLASGVFISGRTQEDMESHDLNFSFIAKTKNKVDSDNMKVTSHFLWGKSTAIYRERFGVTLLREIDENELRSIKFPDGILPAYNGDTIPWPMGDIIPDMYPTAVNKSLQYMTDEIVIEDSYGGDHYAAIIVHKGMPVAESYDDRFDKDTRFLSWSIAKSIMNGILGVKTMLDDGFDINSPVSVAAWDDNKATKGLTWNNLMQMHSGLQWNEDYGNRSDITVMLHEESDFAEYVYTRDFEYEPGTHWHYSSGDNNFISYLLRNTFESDYEYYAFPYMEFLYKIGICDAVLEVDPSGTFVCSSYMYMTARDFARFGLLYLQDGIFCGERILPEGWVDYVSSPSPASGGAYGSLFYLKEGRSEFSSAPDDTYMCIGHDGQRILIIPSHDLIIVLLGYAPSGTVEYNYLIEGIIRSLDATY